jgi:dynein heavy chain
MGETGFAYEKVHIYQINPKAIRMGQLYGEFDPNTHEWEDGILCSLYRGAASDTKPDRKWVVFNGPVDAIWIENMNTVLDDNKKLCLNSGEMVQMSDQMSMIFEVEDLLVASPATVSRVGVVYMEPNAFGLQPLIDTFMEKMPPNLMESTVQNIRRYFEQYVHQTILFVRTDLKELVPTVDNNLCQSLMRILSCYLRQFHPVEGMPPPSADDIKALDFAIESLFIFAMVWSLGATTNDEGRKKFDKFVRKIMEENKAHTPFPDTGGYVYDFTVEYTMTSCTWKGWMSTVVR